MDIWSLTRHVDAGVGDSRLVCNQIGYVYFREYLGGFDDGMFIEV